MLTDNPSFPATVLQQRARAGLMLLQHLSMEDYALYIYDVSNEHSLAPAIPPAFCADVVHVLARNAGSSLPGPPAGLQPMTDPAAGGIGPAGPGGSAPVSA
jgi:hypothetical protein